MKRAWVFLLACGVGLAGGDRAPMKAKFEDSASYRWLNKKVLESRMLDDCESLAGWVPFTTGGIAIVDARETAKVTEGERQVTELALLARGCPAEGRFLRMRFPSGLDIPAPKSGRAWGTAGVRRLFDGEDWRKFNRVSFWVRPECPGYYVTSLELRLFNEGSEKLPALFGQEGETTVVLRDHDWNRVVWEIGNVARDKVASFEISCLLSGSEPEATKTLVFDIDGLELEKVEPDYVEGWAVWPGRIAYSHAGYRPGAEKSAVASGLGVREFRLVDQATGQAVLIEPVRTVATRLGSFQVMDFSEVRKPGTYVLEAEGIRTAPFPISEDAWRSSILKALDFFYAERCGMEIPGVHGVCHRDWTVVHGDRRIVINGGWHDAGDLSQMLPNTAEAVYAMFSLAERLRARDEDPELYARLIEEARWGLDWVLKTSFGDGYRYASSANSRRMNGILGDFDDITAVATNTPIVNFTAAAAEALAARVLEDSDPRLAAYALKMAEDDWRFGMEGLAVPPAKPEGIWRGNFDSGDVVHEAVAEGILAAVDLWKVTGDRRYADKAVELAKTVMDSQERRRPDWDVPLLGFFYAGPAKDRFLHYCHRGREQAPAVAMARLCEAFPDHPDWMKWYSAVALHAEYLKTGAGYSEPYGMMAASIYRDDEYLNVPETRKESFRRQVLEGVPLGKGHFLRRFPVWMDYRGSHGTILPQAQALIEAAHLRGDPKAAVLAERQAEWVIGRNPFAQSTMWGEGHDFTPLYAPLSGDMVGALPVGIQTRGASDVPYWPVQSTWTYKEVWVHPVTRWIWLMRDLAGPALVEGQAGAPVEFEEATMGRRISVAPDPITGRFRIMVSDGTYVMRSGDSSMTRTFLPCGTYEMDLRPGRALDFEAAKNESGTGEVTISVSARGSGPHRFTLRADNLAFSDPVKELVLGLEGKGTLEWRGRIVSTETPWIAVVYPDDDLSRRKEIGDTALVPGL